MKSPTEKALAIFFVDFVDLNMDDRVQMTDVFENEIKSRTFLMLKDPIMRRRWVENQLKKMKEKKKESG